MKHNTFEPCKDHENGHFNWCILCEIEQLRKMLIKQELISGDLHDQIRELKEKIQKEWKAKMDAQYDACLLSERLEYLTGENLANQESKESENPVQINFLIKNT